MNQITFKDFAQNFTRLCAGDFKTACDRYFQYRGMAGQNEMTEKHFLEFLHYLDLEDIFMSKLPSASRDCVFGISQDVNSQRSDTECEGHAHHTYMLSKSTSRVERVLTKN
jgi:hypothetical protein